jgi:hypothetical protein
VRRLALARGNQNGVPRQIGTPFVLMRVVLVFGVGADAHAVERPVDNRKGNEEEDSGFGPESPGPVAEVMEKPHPTIKLRLRCCL